MAGLSKEEQIIETGKVYKLVRLNTEYSSSVNPGLFFKGTGSLNVYGSTEQPSVLADMKIGNTSPIVTFEPFAMIPSYLYVEENAPVIDKVYLIGIDAIEVGFAP